MTILLHTSLLCVIIWKPQQHPLHSHLICGIFMWCCPKKSTSHFHSYFDTEFGLKSLMWCTTPYMWKYSHFLRQTFWIVTILTAISRYLIYVFIGLHTLNLVTRDNAMQTRLPVPNIHTLTYAALIIFSLCFSHISLPMPHYHTSTLRQISFAASWEWSRNDGKRT